MAQVLVRNIEEGLKSKLRRRAKKHGHSMEEEARAILRKALASETEPVALGTSISRMFAGIELEQPIAELRGERPKPAKFKK